MKRLLVAMSSPLLVLAITVPSAFAAKPSSSVRTFAPASSLRGTRGGGVGSPFGYLALHPREYALAKAAANEWAGVGNPGASGGSIGALTVSTYPSVSPSFNGVYQTNLAPPDTTGAIGPDRYIETINTKYAIYTRTGSLIKGGSLSSLTGIRGGLFGYSLSDPQMMWDQKTQRFYYSAVYYNSFTLSDNGLAIGWSKTATPASASNFCKYHVSFGTELPDYPKLGDSSDFLLSGYNLFGKAASTYDGSEFMTLNKPPAGSACAPASAFSLNFFGTGNLATPVPANLVDDSNETGYVVANPDLTRTTGHSSTRIGVFAVSTNGVDGNGHPNPSVIGPTNITVASYSLPSNAPQKGTSALIDTLDGRFEAAMAAVDPAAGGVRIWTAHAVRGSNLGIGAEERWYEINPSGSIENSGAASSSSLFIWNGAVSSDRNGSGSFGDSMAMSVSTSSSTTYPALQFVTAVRSGGVLTQSVLNNLVQAGGPNVDFSCSPCRWGDYSGASPDPVASGTVGTVWLANQWNVASSTSSDTDWRTRIFGVTPA